MTLPDSTRQDWQHALLPAAAVRMLQRATQAPVTQADPLARRKAVDEAAQQVRRMWPQYFREDV